ncbi:nuclear transport factor 2 family protein [Aestuariibacter halophilus]|uniref:Nuclear transport factor 2 family protein n=1 Tax=Fluctibacter halophilus TaxID=226011 RepID=A0ABS8GBE8_9ALTE|nr:nuclear transport factor 2 family protein [Aestuariibacter halophilus]MCC2616546.1 nuclear transport factor 2 family protein [Aestuariibacter halophilus]
MTLLRGILCATVLFSSATMAQDTLTNHCDNTCQTTQINQYYQHISRILMAGSSAEDVDRFLGGLHDDVRYVHAEYSADFDKAIWRRAFLRQLDKGRYTNSSDATPTINRIIHGFNTAAVEVVSRYNDDDSGELLTSPPRLAIFTFEDGKIVAIRDHWYHLAEQ